MITWRSLRESNPSFKIENLGFLRPVIDQQPQTINFQWVRLLRNIEVRFSERGRKKKIVRPVPAPSASASPGRLDLGKLRVDRRDPRRQLSVVFKRPCEMTRPSWCVHAKPNRGCLKVSHEKGRRPGET